MNLTLTGARSLVAIVAITGVTGTAATSASAATKTKAHAKHAKVHAKRLSKKAVARPDLVARGLKLDLTDTGFDVTASVANLGKGYAKSSDVIIALSDDTTLDENDTVLDEYTLPGIAGGVTRSFDDTVDMPDDIDLGSGTAYLLVCADGNEEVTESSESNNCVSQEVDTTDDSSDDSASDDSSDDSSDDTVSAPIDLTGGQ